VLKVPPALLEDFHTPDWSILRQVRMLSWRNHWVRMLSWRNHWARMLSCMAQSLGPNTELAQSLGPNTELAQSLGPNAELAQSLQIAPAPGKAYTDVGAKQAKSGSGIFNWHMLSIGGAVIYASSASRGL
jgi:hypothetical protein